METKRCAKCKQFKPLHEMVARSSIPTGIGSYCLSCKRIMYAQKAKPKLENTYKRHQLYALEGYRWCSGFNPYAKAENGHYAKTSDFYNYSATTGLRCKKCISLIRKHYRQLKRQSKAV